MKFRTIPVIVEAWEWDETIPTLEMLVKKGVKVRVPTCLPASGWVRDLQIQTIDGTMSVKAITLATSITCR